MFLPKHKRRDNLNTKEPLVDKITGAPYYGSYFEASNGKKYTGKSPYDGENRELENLPEDAILPGTDNTIRGGKNAYDVLRNDAEAFKLKFTAPLPVYFPTSIPAGGSFKRYFAKDIRREKIVEISKDTYTSLKNRDTKYYYPNFVIAEVTWVVEGLLEDTTVGSYIVPSISSQNKNTIQSTNRLMPGLSDFITDYTQFAR